MRVALIGYGYWGMNLARTITNNINMELISIFDAQDSRIQEAQKLYTFKSYSSLDILMTSDIDAVFIATPPATHFEVAKKALENDKHIFVEKPFTLCLNDAYELIELAEKRDLIYMVDHIFVYSEPVKYLKKNLENFGELVYINARRINLGLFQHTTDVIWDLAVHDLSIIEYLVGLDIEKVSVFKKKYKDFPNEAIANINLELKSGLVVNINVSWLSPVKVREMIIGGTKMSAIYDDTESDKIKLYDGGVILEKELNTNELYNYMIQYKYGEVTSPILPNQMSLDNVVQHFFESIDQHTQPMTSKTAIINVTKVLEIISKVG